MQEEVCTGKQKESQDHSIVNEREDGGEAGELGWVTPDGGEEARRKDAGGGQLGCRHVVQARAMQLALAHWQ